MLHCNMDFWCSAQWAGDGLDRPLNQRLSYSDNTPYRNKAMTGTELEIIPADRPEFVGSAAERLPSVHTNASNDHELLAVWLKSHADGSRHTRRAYARIGCRFLEALSAAGSDLRRATVDDVQTALEAMRIKGDGSASSAATVNTYVAAVKALLCLPIRWASPASTRRR